MSRTHLGSRDSESVVGRDKILCSNSLTGQPMLLVHRMHLEQQRPRAGWAEFSCKGPGSPFPGFVGLMVSAQKNIYFCFIDYAKAFDCVDHNKLENLKRWEYQTTLPVS